MNEWSDNVHLRPRYLINSVYFGTTVANNNSIALEDRAGRLILPYTSQCDTSDSHAIDRSRKNDVQ